MTTTMVTEQELTFRMQSLLEDVQRGAEIVIFRSGKPLARLLPIEKDKSPIRFGVLRNKARVAKDFDAPLPEDILAALAPISGCISLTCCSGFSKRCNIRRCIMPAG